VEDITETAWRTYEIVNEWIRYSDTKAGAILAADGVIAGIVLSILPNQIQLDIIPCISIVFLVLGVVSGCLSVFFSIRCLNPTLKMGEPKSMLYFAHIAKKYNGPKEYKKDFIEIFSKKDTFVNQITEQIWANSKVAQKKYIAVTWATRFFGAIITIIIMSFIVSWF